MNSIFEIIIKLALTVPLSIWFYKDSKARDYYWLFWTFIPFLAFFSPLRLAVIYCLVLFLIYLLLRPKGSLFKCPHCGKNVHNILFICPFCHKNAKRECLHCHEPVPWEAEQCPFCKSKALTNE